MPESETRVIVYDGFCHVCSGGIRFLEKHRVEPPFEVLPTASERGRALLIEHGIDPEDPSTFLVLDEGRAYTASDASIHVAATVGGIWRLALAARIVPRSWRDALYSLIARNRYRWFGRRTTCYLPSARR
jgi:predicted DCC family thiol-disulfide oxidoreductase YuxK